MLQVNVLKRFLTAMTITMIATAAGMDVAVSAGIKSLVMPGQVIEGHAKYEDECGRCHKPFSKESQSRMCLDCHEKVDDDIRQKQGSHGMGKTRDIDCNYCHTEHKGRDADIIQMGIETFDHDSTDYLLKGAHIMTNCDACHVPGKKYREAPKSCVKCHKENDNHKGHLGDKCADCHDERSWLSQEFDHDATEFTLLEKHADVECNSCHVNQQYKDLPKDCHVCHGVNDVHAGRYGPKCSECHSEAGWDRTRFDHDRDTEYSLDGKHGEVKCDVCHAGKLHQEKLDSECISCHRGDDEHNGRYGRKCQSCHKPHGWDKARFDHAVKTDYPLRGRHQEVSCASCHRGEAYEEKLASDCFSCHGQDDAHKGQEGEQCEQCHDEDGWGERVRFEHDMTSFPLIGLHAVTPCEECHLNTEFKMAVSDCGVCHQPDDVHELRLGQRCERCHNPNGWSLWEFDHNVQTDYSLDGAHEGIDCLSCHDRDASQGIKMSTACADCHRADDVHDGQFGRYCDRCHITKSFDVVEIR
ncbi:MAG: cytochrome C [Pseudomonadota bacterium]